jgi:acyl carrier protein
MTRPEIERRVTEILSRKLDVAPEGISVSTRLTEDLGLDSFASVELVFELEEAFGLNIPDSGMAGMRCVGDVVAEIQRWLEVGTDSPGSPSP